MTIDSYTRRFSSTKLEIVGLVALKRHQISDSRGFFSRVFCAEELISIGWDYPVAQLNHSFTAKAGTLRGLHYQMPPYADAKMVICLSGRVWDVAVDLRAESPTYLHWCAQEISAENQISLLIPPGCAHGFQTLSDDVELLYVHSKPFHSASDAGINPLARRLGVPWPLPIGTISDKDMLQPEISDDFKGLQL